MTEHLRRLSRRQASVSSSRSRPPTRGGKETTRQPDSTCPASPYTWYFRESILNCNKVIAPTDPRKEVRQMWDSMQGWIKIIMDNYTTYSIFPLANGAAACDLVLLCRDATKEDTYHFVAVELKDSRSTKSKDWRDKLNLLKSCQTL
eukprot:gene27610-36334_t